MALRAVMFSVAPGVFSTGLTGVATFTVNIKDVADTDIVAATNTGITEYPAGSKRYRFTTGVVIDDSKAYQILWHDSVAGLWAYEDLRPVYPVDVRAQGKVNGGSPTTTSFTVSGITSANDHYKNMTIVFTTGALAGVARKISGQAALVLTVSTAFRVAPADQDQFDIIGYMGP